MLLFQSWISVSNFTQMRLPVFPLKKLKNFGAKRTIKIKRNATPTRRAIKCLSIFGMIKIRIISKFVFLFFKMGQSRPVFCLFSFFSCCNFNNTNWKSIDGVLGIQTWGCRMVGADETTELWWMPKFVFL